MRASYTHKHTNLYKTFPYSMCLCHTPSHTLIASKLSLRSSTTTCPSSDSLVGPSSRLHPPVNCSLFPSASYQDQPHRLSCGHVDRPPPPTPPPAMRWVIVRRMYAHYKRKCAHRRCCRRRRRSIACVCTHAAFFGTPFDVCVCVHCQFWHLSLSLFCIHEHTGAHVDMHSVANAPAAETSGATR